MRAVFHKRWSNLRKVNFYIYKHFFMGVNYPQSISNKYQISIDFASSTIHWYIYGEVDTSGPIEQYYNFCTKLTYYDRGVLVDKPWDSCLFFIIFYWKLVNVTNFSKKCSPQSKWASSSLLSTSVSKNNISNIFIQLSFRGFYHSGSTVINIILN